MRFHSFDKLVTATAVTFLCLAFPAAAQQSAESEGAGKLSAKEHRTVIKATMHIEVTEAQSVLNLLDVNYALKPDQNLIVLRGEGYAIETALKVLDALDEPRPSIDLHVFVLSASKQGAADVPADLKAATEQLKGVFGYSGFQVLDNVTLRVLEGRSGRAGGAIRLGDDTTRTGYDFSFQKVSVVPEDDILKIRIKGLEFNVNSQTSDAQLARLMTDVQIREGQKAVIGSSTPQGVGDTLILIVQATATKDPTADND